MFKFFVPLMVTGAFLMSSCKKDHNCECTLEGEVITTVYKNISTSEAESNCQKQDQTYQSENGSCELN